MTSQLKLVYVLVGRDDVTSEPGCPVCESGSLWLEHEEDSSLSISSLEIALATLEQAEVTLNQAMKELLSWRTYQSQS